MFELRWKQFEIEEFRHSKVFGSKPEVVKVKTEKLQSRQRKLTINIWGDVIVKIPEQWTEWEDVPTDK